MGCSHSKMLTADEGVPLTASSNNNNNDNNNPSSLASNTAANNNNNDDSQQPQSSSLSAIAGAIRKKAAKSQKPKKTSGDAASSTSTPRTRDRLDSWQTPTTALSSSPSKQQQQQHSFLHHHRHHHHQPSVEAQWKLLWKTQSPLMLDPADVHAVLDELQSQVINRLSPTELEQLQRSVRNAVKSMTALSQTKSRSMIAVPAAVARVGSYSASNSSHQTILETRAITKQFLMNETLLSKLLLVWMQQKDQQQQQHQQQLYPLLLHNTYSLLLHLSESLWDRVADIAAHAAQKAGLEMDVNNKTKTASTSTSSSPANKATTTPRDMPKPSIVPDVEAPEKMPPGCTLASFCFLTALALKGTRPQKLQLLFYLLLQDLDDFLDTHPAGSVPCWLMEVDQEVVVSLASLTHYHYYGHAFLPKTITGTTASAFVESKSRRPVSICASQLRDLVACCLQEPPPRDAAADAATESGGGTTTPPLTPSRRNSKSDHSLSGLTGAAAAANTTTATSITTSRLAKRRSNNDSSLEQQQTDGVAGVSTLEKRLAVAAEMGTDYNDDFILEASRQRFLAACASTSSSNANAPDDESFLLLEKNNNGDDRMTLQDFKEWADQALDDVGLDAVMYRLFATGLLPSHSLEREWVQEKWTEWQQTVDSIMTMHSGADHASSGEGTIEQFLTQSVKALLDVCSMNGTVVDPEAQQASNRKIFSTVWGGVGGVDGGGGIGYGVLYCIDKKWWDAWADYVGWSWLGERPARRRSLERPGVLSTERLLDRGEDAVIGGTLGSYEMMKHGLERNKDYVLVPPGVWDVLYELYGGGPPLPRMVNPPERKMSDTVNRTISGIAESSFPGHGAEDLDSIVEEINGARGERVLQLPDGLSVALHPWVIHVHLCDPTQPYRRGEAGTVSIRVMAAPDQALWRLFAEVIVRFPLKAYKAFGSDGRGRARLWKKIEPSGAKDPASRYGPWNLLCKNRHATFPLLTNGREISDHYSELVENWKEFTDNATVESIGLGDRNHIMLEFAVLNKNGDLSWPREAAAKAGRVRLLAEEDRKFRRILQGVDEKGAPLLKPPNLVGMDVDAMDSTGRWYAVTILETDVVDEADEELENEDDASSGKEKAAVVSRKMVRVDFKEHGGHEEWIDVESDRLAKAGRFTSETERQNSTSKMNGTHASGSNDTKPKTAAPVKKNSNSENGAESGKICLWPGYGACGLTNLGNTCYMNSAAQCISYLPLLRSYLLSSQYKITGDLNRDNPLGTGGKLLEEFSDLLRVLWSARLGEKSPMKFRSQLGKLNPQFSGADQQDAQEFLSYILDILHEDSNKVRKKPFVEALEDDWVKKTSLSRVGDESWRRFLRRNRSIMTDVAMGQVLNTVTCPVCNFSSRNFDPFNLLSIPIPTVADVVFQCTVLRRATALNCPSVLNRPRRGEKRSVRFMRRMSSSNSGPPSETFVAEQYVIAMSRLADSGDLRLQIQNACGIPANRLRLCRAEGLAGHKVDGKSVVKRHMKVVPLSDKEGPCSQLAKKKAPGNEDSGSSPTFIVAFETTVKVRPMPSYEAKDGTEALEDTADEDEDGEVDDDQLFPTAKEQAEIERYLEVYGDEKECRLVDTNPLILAKAVSRSMWPLSPDHLKLGLRVDAKDSRGNWFPGSVVEIIDDDDVMDGDNIHRTEQGFDNGVAEPKVRVHFDNFSSKWDETYIIEHFQERVVRPLYSHALPRPKPTEFVVHHRHTDRSTGNSLVFGQSFYVQCQNEWSNARAGAHILAQASRFLRHQSFANGVNDRDDPVGADREAKVRRLYDKTQSTISELIDTLVDIDREYIRLALGVSERNSDEERAQPYRNPAFDPTPLSTVLVQRVSALLHRLPFEVRVCTVETQPEKKASTSTEEISFPFSLIRTIGNYINARHAIVLHWREPPADKRSYLGAPVLYVEPKVEVDEASAEILKSKAKLKRDGGKKSRPGSGGIDLGVCLTEFCKVQNLSIADCWRCPHCKEYREGRQSMNMWRLPDLMTFHIKRFNMSARWREKITTKVNFPLTGLDMSQWCHKNSPTVETEPDDACIYDLIGVVNHYGSMTGGHYVAICKATSCGREGREEIAFDFNGVGTNTLETEETDEPTGWRLGRPKAEVNQNKVTAAMHAKAASESAEPLWLQFDDELVEPIPPEQVVSEMAYVLFYRRRRMTSSNIAKYSTLE